MIKPSCLSELGYCIAILEGILRSRALSRPRPRILTDTLSLTTTERRGLISTSTRPSMALTLQGVRRVAASGQHAPSLQDMTCIAFSGVLLSSRRVLSEISPVARPDLTVNEALEANGEWLAVFQGRTHPDEYVVLTDAYAFQTLFHCAVEREDGPRLVLGTSARAVAHERRALGVDMDPDWEHIAGTVLSTDWLTSNIMSDRTADRATLTMRPFEMMVISRGEARVVPRAGLDDLNALNYKSLLERGSAAAIAQVKVLGSAGFPSLRINLSGGKDSRLMMAMLVGAGVQNKFEVRSVNPRTWGVKSARAGLEKDLLLADTIRRRYRMRWAEEPEFDTFMATPFEPIEWWQDDCGELNYSFRLNRRRRIRSVMVGELRGASGETFRGTNYWRRYRDLPGFQGTPEGFESDLRLAFDHIYRTDLVSGEHAEGMFDHFSEALRSTGRTTLVDAGDRHYTLYRNRAHFGTALRFAQEGAIPFFPLNQPAFTWAGERIDPDLRREGAVFHDLIELMAPELNDLPFDADQWTDRVRSRRTSGRPVHTWQVTQSADEATEYWQNEERAARSMRESEAAARPATSMIASTKAYVAFQLRATFDELLQLPGAKDWLSPRVGSWLMSLPEQNLNFAQTQLGKLVSVRDAVVGKAAGVRLFRTLDGNESQDGLNALTWTGARAPSGFRRDLDVLLYRVAVSREGGEVVTEALVDHGGGHDLEFAFYLRRGRTVVERKLYSGERSARFDAPEGGGPYHVQAFARYRRRQQQLFVLQSVEVD